MKARTNSKTEARAQADVYTRATDKIIAAPSAKVCCPRRSGRLNVRLPAEANDTSCRFPTTVLLTIRSCCSGTQPEIVLIWSYPDLSEQTVADHLTLAHCQAEQHARRISVFQAAGCDG